jgi:hypothetical protein
MKGLISRSEWDFPPAFDAGVRIKYPMWLDVEYHFVASCYECRLFVFKQLALSLLSSPGASVYHRQLDQQLGNERGAVNRTAEVVRNLFADGVFGIK